MEIWKLVFIQFLQVIKYSTLVFHYIIILLFNIKDIATMILFALCKNYFLAIKAIGKSKCKNAKH